MSDEKKLSPEEFAEKATDILWPSLSKLPEEEQDQRLAAFSKAVNEACSRYPKDEDKPRTRSFLARTLERVGLR